MIILNSNIVNERRFYNTSHTETELTAHKIEYVSDRETCILKEWYGCRNKLNFYNGFSTSKIIEETITYKNANSIDFKIKNYSKNSNFNSFWIKLKDYKFKVSILKNYNLEDKYIKYQIEYNKKWGLIPDENTRYDISNFLSFIIGTKLVKFGESHYDNKIISKNCYKSPTPIDISFLYQTNFTFFYDGYEHNDTDNVIKQIPKMLNNYLMLKDKYRLNEVLPTLFIHSYTNFNFINYVTYIEMFSNIEIGTKNFIIPKAKFKVLVKNLKKVKGVPISIKEKFQELNTMGIGKKIKKLLSKYKIKYDRYKDVFEIRGKVVHGAQVDFLEMCKASEKAKELLTILTLKKLQYRGYIRNFINNNELILLKDYSSLLL